jgi:hypothetical protein
MKVLSHGQTLVPGLLIPPLEDLEGGRWPLALKIHEGEVSPCQVVHLRWT